MRWQTPGTSRELSSNAMANLVLVSDAVWVANEVEAALSIGGWHIQIVSDPRQAVNVVNEVRPEAVLIDMQVGSMGGMAVTRAIRQSAELRPRLIMLLDRSADDFLARRAGSDASVLKPLTAQDLRRALAEAEEE